MGYFYGPCKIHQLVQTKRLFPKRFWRCSFLKQITVVPAVFFMASLVCVALLCVHNLRHQIYAVIMAVTVKRIYPILPTEVSVHETFIERQL